MTRVDDTPIHNGLRECLANALIHADYYGRRGIVIDKEFHKITFSNPGTFRISIDEAIAGGISDARNGRIFNMFSLINIGERSGSGLCDVYHIWEENGFNRPEIVETVEPSRIIITLSTDLADSEGNHDGNDGNHEGNDDNYEGNHDGNNIKDTTLTDNEVRVLRIISEQPSLPASKISAEIGVSKSTVERTIRLLKLKGIVKREGSTRGRWILIKNEEI